MSSPLTQGELNAALIRYATAEFAPKTPEGSLPEFVQRRVNTAVLRMATARRTTQADLDEAQRAFSLLVAESLRRSLADGRAYISADDFDKAWYSNEAQWPFAL